MVEGFFVPENGANNFLRIVGKFLPEYTASYPRKHERIKIVIPPVLHTVEQVSSIGNASDISWCILPGLNLGEGKCYPNILAVGPLSIHGYI
jgi:hypothetical protein